MGAASIFMKILLTAMAGWLAVSTDLPVSFDQPTVVFAPTERIAALRYPSVNTAFRPNVLAVYDDAHRTIHLHDAWTGTSVADLSVLVHEMVHHLQNRAGLTYACPGAREAAAYEAQQRFLRLFGQNLAGAFQLDKIALKLMTSCLLL